MNGGDELFGVVHTEGVHLRLVCFPKTGATKVQGRVLVDRPVSIAELERTLQDTDGVVDVFLLQLCPSAMLIRREYRTCEKTRGPR
jgi:hypothetical protein